MKWSNTCRRTMSLEAIYAMEDGETLLGEGVYGTVSKAYDKATGAAVAVKKMKFHSDEEGVPQHALREIALLRSPC